MNNFKIVINGNVFEDMWEFIDINQSIETFSGSIAVKTADIFEKRPDLWNVKKGDGYVAYVNNEKVGTGYIYDIILNYTEKSQFISFTGRDKTSDLVDCSFEGNSNEWIRASIFKIVTGLCKPFGITVVADKSVLNKVNSRIATFTANHGQPVYEIIVRMCMKYGIVPITIGDGKLLLTKTTSSNYATDVLGVNNVLEGQLFTSDANRYSEVNVKGYFTGALKLVQMGEYLASFGRHTDEGIKRNRPLVIFSDSATTNTEARQRAKYEVHLRAGEASNLEYVLEGWKETTEDKIWKINTLVPVNDAKLAVKDTLLISEVNFNYDPSSGFITKLKLIDKNTFDLEGKIRTLEERKWF